MKTLITLMILVFSLSAMAQDRGTLNQLLLEKGTSIAALEIQGMRLVMGERTGGGRNLQFASVEVVFTKDEAILRKEIQNVRQNGSTLGALESIQAGGRQIEASDIIGVISK
jgi:hypothetical protein